jgi:phosphatidylglycerol:prolipoprotein diacylglycerol transferase
MRSSGTRMTCCSAAAAATDGQSSTNSDRTTICSFMACVYLHRRRPYNPASMLQELFRIPIPDWVPLLPREIPVFGYGLMLVIGFYCGMQLGRALARRVGIDPDVVVNVALIALIFGIAGARLSHILENIGEYTRADRSAWDNLVAALNIRSGGLTFFGGLILATVACLIYGAIRRVPLRLGMDVIAPCVMIGLAFGRVGCFMNGCCHGAECNVSWAVHFPYHSNAYLDQYDLGEVNPPPELMTLDKKGKPRLMTVEEAHADPGAAELLRHKVPGVTASLPVHPSQLYSSVNAFLIAGVLVAYFTTQPAPGRVFALMMILKGLTRFILEMIRAEPAVWGNLSFSMVVSIPLFVGGIVMWLICGRLDRSRPKFEYDSPPATATPVPAGG